MEGKDLVRRKTDLRTTTMGDSELVIMPKPFQIIKPEAMTVAKFKAWSST